MDKLDGRSALRLAEDAIARAHAGYQQRPISVAVCDPEGFLTAFLRADGAPVRGVAIAQGKAYSAARMGVSTAAFLERLHREQIEPSFFCDPNLTGLPGGSVLKDADAKIIGAIGISGLTSREDQEIADAIAAAWSR